MPRNVAWASRPLSRERPAPVWSFYFCTAGRQMPEASHRIDARCDPHKNQCAKHLGVRAARRRLGMPSEGGARRKRPLTRPRPSAMRRRVRGIFPCFNNPRQCRGEVGATLVVALGRPRGPPLRPVYSHLPNARDPDESGQDAHATSRTSWFVKEQDQGGVEPHALQGASHIVIPDGSRADGVRSADRAKTTNGLKP